MCHPILVGMAIGAAVGAATSAATGGDVLEGAIIGAAVGGFTGGVSPGTFATTGTAATTATTGTTAVTGGTALAGTAATGTYATTAYSLGSAITPAAWGLTAGQTAAFGYATMATGTGLAMGMLTPQQQDYSQSYTGLQTMPQPYSSQHTQVTGSGGRQASAVLASEIKRAKSLRRRQAAGSEAYGLDMDVAGTGLQIA